MAQLSMQWPVFIIGLHRSGTTLLRYILNSHPNLACPPESKFLLGLQEGLQYPQTYAGLRGMGLTRKDIFSYHYKMVHSIFDEYARKAGKTRYVDKTPNYYRSLPFIDELYDQKVLFVILVRHPLDCIESIERYFFIHKAHEDPDIAMIAERFGTDRYACARYWSEGYQMIREFQARCDHRSHVLTYEDMVTNTAVSIGETLKFIGEESHQGADGSCLKWDHRLGFGDKSIRKTESIDPARIGKWCKWPPGEVKMLWNIVGEQAREYGYVSPV